MNRVLALVIIVIAIAPPSFLCYASMPFMAAPFEPVQKDCMDSLVDLKDTTNVNDSKLFTLYSPYFFHFNLALPDNSPNNENYTEVLKILRADTPGYRKKFDGTWTIQQGLLLNDSIHTSGVCKLFFYQKKIGSEDVIQRTSRFVHSFA